MAGPTTHIPPPRDPARAPPSDPFLSRGTILQILVLVAAIAGLKIANMTTGGFGRRAMNNRHDEPPRLAPARPGERLRELGAPPRHTRAVAACIGLDVGGCVGGGGDEAPCVGGDESDAAYGADAEQLAGLAFSSRRGLVEIGEALTSSDAATLIKLGACVARCGCV